MQRCRKPTRKEIFHLGIKEKLSRGCGSVSPVHPQEDARDPEEPGSYFSPSKPMPPRRKGLQQVAWQPGDWEEPQKAKNAVTTWGTWALAMVTFPLPQTPSFWSGDRRSGMVLQRVTVAGSSGQEEAGWARPPTVGHLPDFLSLEGTLTDLYILTVASSRVPHWLLDHNSSESVFQMQMIFINFLQICQFHFIGLPGISISIR